MAYQTAYKMKKKLFGLMFVDSLTSPPLVVIPYKNITSRHVFQIHSAQFKVEVVFTLHFQSAIYSIYFTPFCKSYLQDYRISDIPYSYLIPF